jgi:hypothetical protein
MKILIICTLPQIELDDQTNGGKISGESKDEKFLKQFQSENVVRSKRLGDVRVDRIIILKWFSRNRI